MTNNPTPAPPAERIKPWPKPEVKATRRPRNQARRVLLEHGMAHYDKTGELISLNKVCGLAGKTTGYGYQLYGGRFKPGVEWREELQVAIVEREWFDHDGQLILARLADAVRQDWVHSDPVRLALAEQIRDLEHAHMVPGVADGSPGPDVASLLWEFIKSTTAAPRS